MRVLLDIDDVLCDCTTAIYQWYGVPHGDSVWDYYPPVGRDIGAALNASTKSNIYTGQTVCDYLPYEFWTAIPVSKHAGHLVQEATSLVGSKNVYLCSTPTANRESYAGKKAWVDQHFPGLSNQIVLTAHKHLLAHPDAILIDDAPINCDRFVAAGGKALLWAAPWNNGIHPLTLLEKLRKIIHAHENESPRVLATVGNLQPGAA